MTKNRTMRISRWQVH